jgi:hypothetical protein
MSDQVLHPHKTREKIIGLYILANIITAITSKKRRVAEHMEGIRKEKNASSSLAENLTKIHQWIYLSVDKPITLK